MMILESHKTPFATPNTDVVFINDLKARCSESNESPGELRYWGECVKRGHEDERKH